MKAISIKNLNKTYKEGHVALKNVDLEVAEGDFFALLGPNGAGKTTIIGILTSLVNKNSGNVKIFGVDIDEDFDLAKTYLGVVPQEFNFNIFETPYDILITQAGYYGIPRNIARERAEFYLKKLGLWDKKDVKSMTLSGGMKRRLMIARALIHEPKILILDEPTAGVDIELRREMWEFVKEINSKKKVTIILTTHYLEEAEELCKYVAIINQGEIIESSPIKDLLKKADVQTFVLDVEEDLNEAPKIRAGKINLVDKNTLEVVIPKSSSLSNVFRELGDKIHVVSMRNKRNRLEELFIDLIRGKNGKK